MKYMFLLYSKEPMDDLSPETLAPWNEFNTKHAAKIAGSGALHPTSTATTLRLREGKVLTTDGPFAETKEQFGGFYVMECRDLDEALEIARDIPLATTGSVEVRPVLDIEAILSGDGA